MIAALLSGMDYTDECDAWAIFKRGESVCHGVVTQWRDKRVLAVRRLGGMWAHLQLIAYTDAYPALVDAATTLSPR